MFENLTNGDIQTALNELIPTFGVSEETDVTDLLSLIERDDIQGCVEGLARRLGLPIRVQLKLVRAGSAGFQSTAMSKGGAQDGGAISAQVVVPQDLPFFGTSALVNYPIQFFISDNCCECPGAFVAVMAHELSHVLLHSVRHPEQESELHTDLVPLLLGFRHAIMHGRKVLRNSSNGTVTTTYGYLTDAQVHFACAYLSSILQEQQSEIAKFLSSVSRADREYEIATELMNSFVRLLCELDRRRYQKMSESAAFKIVEFHNPDYLNPVRVGLGRVEETLQAARDNAARLTRCDDTTRIELGRLESLLKGASIELYEIMAKLKADVEVLRKQTGIVQKLRNFRYFRTSL